MLSVAPTADAVDAGHALNGVSCPSMGFCVAVDNAGNEIQGNPLGTAKRPVLRIQGAKLLLGISCSSPSECVAVNATGEAFLGETAVRYGSKRGSG